MPPVAPNILVVEDDRETRALIAKYLRNNACNVTTANDGREMARAMTDHRVDLVILDVMLPGEDGLSLCRKIRGESQVPIIMLTARGEESERVRGLAIGADDYVVKPFSVPELMARVHALLRRARPDRANGMLSAGDLDLDRQNWRVRRGGREVHMGPTEFRLLDHLMGKPGRVFSRAQLLDCVWGLSAEIDERTVDVHIGRLRKALSKDAEKDPIRTVRGAGYAFDETFGRMD